MKNNEKLQNELNYWISLENEGVKLEDQLLITENGPERLSHFPFDDRLLMKHL